MLDMKSRTASLALSVGAAAIIAACSSPEDPAPVAPVSSSTGGITSTPTSTAATVGPVGTTSGTTSAGATGSSGGSGGTSSAAASSSETCDPPPSPAADVALGGIYDYGDTKTTRNFTQPMPNVLCLDGTAYPSAGETDDYEFWGAGMGLQLSPDAVMPYNAAALNIAGVQFDLTDWLERPVRVQMSQVNDPAITDATMNFEENGFVYGGSSPKATKADKKVTIMFEDFKLPSWSAIPDANQGPLDASKLHSLQIQIANEPKDEEAAYKFCITNVEWLDACGQVVGSTTLPMPEANSTDSSGDTGSGATDTSGGSDTGSDSSASESTGSDSASTSGSTDSAGSDSSGSDSSSSDMSGDLLVYATDIQPIFEEKCGGCHSTGSWYGDGTMEPGDPVKAEIAERIQLADGAQGKMPAQGSLSEDEIAAIVAWSEQ
jgi:hypothetical protein